MDATANGFEVSVEPIGGLAGELACESASQLTGEPTGSSAGEPTGDVLVEARGVSKAFGDNVILRDVDIMLRRGESLALVGPSGCGKSTLLSMLGLLLESTSGTIAVSSEPVDFKDRERIAQLRRTMFGFVFQHTQLISSLDVWGNVTVPARFAGSSLRDGSDVNERAAALLSRFGLDDRIDYYPHQLSVGQKRRVVLARALLMEPAVLIADEPTNDLDERNAEGVISALLSHVEAGGALIYTTHDRNLPNQAFQVLRIEDGRLYDGLS